ncbi:Bifunctional protein gal10 [Neolecta irregularis DAH-3]|uniref:Bifunctional protein gal10 n=1 Tax=Neolecta irregularis (strain DAH-3) TaxID=1198029 RepID=A0A1U7LRU7_NEOID|nr:Bifunctional protein gal10 [Neolecta irregularis DAH-3]|eukprot:OLL25272.1 Bifunctional protein gal10 [Neolecta irregularis DAH-3]
MSPATIPPLKETELTTLISPSGLLTCTLLNQGPSIVSLTEISTQRNLVLGYSTADRYSDPDNPFLGATIGRVANRIANAQINDLNGQSYPLAANDANNCLHGGPNGFHMKLWNSHVTIKNGKQVVLYHRISPHLEEGFPGDLSVKVSFGLDEIEDIDGNKRGLLDIEYEAQLVGDVEETAVNLTNHTYFNLGQDLIDGMEITLGSNQYLEIDSSKLPTGRILAHPDVPLDSIGTPTAISLSSSTIFDHCFILDSPFSIDTRLNPLQTFASVYSPATNLHLEAQTTEPSFQFYTGHGLNIPAKNGDVAFKPRAGLCLETGRYLNAVNFVQWKAMSVLKRSAIYGSRTKYIIWAGSK